MITLASLDKTQKFSNNIKAGHISHSKTDQNRFLPVNRRRRKKYIYLIQSYI